MPILTFGGQKDENQPEALRLLALGDIHLDQGDDATAIDCYIKAADLVPEIPVDYAIKAFKLLLANNVIFPRFEAARMAGSFMLIAHDVVGSDELLDRVFMTFEAVLRHWRRANLAPLQHMVMLGEGGMVSLVHPIWNSGGSICDEWKNQTEKPEVLEDSVKTFAEKKYFYAIEIDTLYGWRPFNISPAIKNDDDIWSWLSSRGYRGIQYISPTFLPILNRVLMNNGKKPIVAKVNFELSATMKWYENFGYNMEKCRLDGWPEQDADNSTSNE